MAPLKMLLYYLFSLDLYFNLGVYEVLDYNLKNCIIIPNVMIWKKKKIGNFTILEIMAGEIVVVKVFCHVSRISFTSHC